EEPEVVRVITEPDAENDAALGEQIDHRHVLGEVHRIVVRRLQHERAEIDPGRTRRVGGEHHQRRGKHGLGAVMPLGKKDAVEARALGLDALGEQLVAESRGLLRRRLRLIVRAAVGIGHVRYFHTEALRPNQRANRSRSTFRKYRQKLRKIPCRTTSPGAAVTSASIAVKNWASIVLAAPSLIRWPTEASGPPIWASPSYLRIVLAPASSRSSVPVPLMK